jgi:anti-sigma factor RsiW
MNPCQRFRKFIFDFIDNELDLVRKKELKTHLNSCHHCAQHEHQLRLLRSHLGNLSRIRVTEDFQVLLRNRIRRELAGKGTSFSPWILGLRWIPAVGVLVIVLATGLFILDQKPTITPASSISDVNVPSHSTVQPDFQGSVQYVIDEFSSPVSVSRQDAVPMEVLALEDTLILPQEENPVRSHLVPVNF